MLADPARGNGHVNCIRDAVVYATEPGHYPCYGVFATEPDHDVCDAADRRQSNPFGNLVVVLSPRSGHATEQANKSGGTLATIQSIHDSAEKPQIAVKDEHHCRRALLLASYAIVRNDSNGKQGWPRNPVGEIAANMASPIGETGAEHPPNAAILCEDCDEADHGVLCDAM